MSSSPAARRFGRYVSFLEIGAGGMASVHVGRMDGPERFARRVALKLLHPTYARDPDFLAIFLEEARLAGRLHHPNVVGVLDCVVQHEAVVLVMDYVHGEALSTLVRLARARGEGVPVAIATRLTLDLLEGLHAAHEACGPDGAPLVIVHRDVSPQNLMVGADGVARLLDFGIAKAAGRAQLTREGQLKGKLSYMSPEQARAEPVDRRTDVYAAGIVLWEMLVGERLFRGDDEVALWRQVIEPKVEPPSRRAPGTPRALDAVVMRALAPSREHRFSTARAMASALEIALPPASPREVADWVNRLAGATLAARAARIAACETGGLPAPPAPVAALAQARAMTSETFAEAPTRVGAELAVRPARKRRWWLVVPTAGLLAAGWVVSRRQPEIAPSAADGLRQRPPAPQASHEPPAGQPTPPPSQEPPAGKPPGPSAGGARAKPRPPAPRTSRSGPAAKRAAAPPASEDCAEKFIIDANGVAIPKRHCL